MEATIQGRPGFVDYRQLCVYRQVRDGDTSEDTSLTELARNMAKLGQQTPLLVALWGKGPKAQYAELSKKIFNGDGKPRFDNAAPFPDGRYGVMLAGHRRRKVFEMMRSVGSDILEPFYPSLSPEEAFQRRFCGDARNRQPGHVSALFYEDITAEEGLEIQLGENIHRKGVQKYVEAKSIKGLFDLKLHEAGEAGLTVAQFTKNHPSISESAVRDALRFGDLPKSIRHAIEAGKFKWGCGMELGHIQKVLKEQPQPDGTMRTTSEIELILMRLASIEAAKGSVQEFHDALKSWLAETKGQDTLFDLKLTPNELARFHLGTGLLRGSAEHTAFLRKLQYALEHHWVQEGELIPFHEPETRKAVTLMLEQQEALFPILEHVLDEFGMASLRQRFVKNKAALALIQLLATDC